MSIPVCRRFRSPAGPRWKSWPGWTCLLYTSKNSFFQIFRNRRYIGEYRYKDIVTPGGIPAIVDQDLLDVYKRQARA